MGLPGVFPQRRPHSLLWCQICQSSPTFQDLQIPSARVIRSMCDAWVEYNCHATILGHEGPRHRAHFCHFLSAAAPVRARGGGRFCSFSRESVINALLSCRACGNNGGHAVYLYPAVYHVRAPAWLPTITPCRTIAQETRISRSIYTTCWLRF